MTAIQKGDVVKSLDFPGHDDCFIIGEVLEVYEEYFTMKCSLRIVKGIIRDGSIGGIYEVPKIGKALFDDSEGDRLVVLCSPTYDE